MQPRPTVCCLSDSNIDSALHHHCLSTVPHWMVTLNKHLLKRLLRRYSQRAFELVMAAEPDYEAAHIGAPFDGTTCHPVSKICQDTELQYYVRILDSCKGDAKARRTVGLIGQMIPKHTLLKSHLVDHKVVRAVTLDD